MDYLKSLYIDNELSLDEKLGFIERIKTDPSFHEDTRSLILQERLMRQVPDNSMLPDKPPQAIELNDYLKRLVKPVVYASAGFILAMSLLFRWPSDPAAPPSKNRFVIYEPAAAQVELIGSFTSWKKTSMMPIGTTGYWELKLKLPSGEHRFSYIIDGNRQIADPTLPVRERDDFGGENSILKVETQT